MIEKKIETDNITIALNVLYAKKEKRCPSYVSKHNSNGEKHIVLLMIPNGEKIKVRYQGQWYYLALNNYQLY